MMTNDQKTPVFFYHSYGDSGLLDRQHKRLHTARTIDEAEAIISCMDFATRHGYPLHTDTRFSSSFPATLYGRKKASWPIVVDRDQEALDGFMFLFYVARRSPSFVVKVTYFPLPSVYTISNWNEDRWVQEGPVFPSESEVITALSNQFRTESIRLHLTSDTMIHEKTF